MEHETAMTRERHILYSTKRMGLGYRSFFFFKLTERLSLNSFRGSKLKKKKDTEIKREESFIFSVPQGPPLSSYQKAYTGVTLSSSNCEKPHSVKNEHVPKKKKRMLK